MDKIGFNASVESLLSEFETKCDFGDKCPDNAGDETRISPDTAINLYRIIQESLSNVVQHSNSKTAFVSMRAEGSDLVIEVMDEGCGLLVNEPSGKLNFGILGMRERANMIGGHFEIISSPEKGPS